MAPCFQKSVSGSYISLPDTINAEGFPKAPVSETPGQPASPLHRGWWDPGVAPTGRGRLPTCSAFLQRADQGTASAHSCPGDTCLLLKSEPPTALSLARCDTWQRLLSPCRRWSPSPGGTSWSKSTGGQSRKQLPEPCTWTLPRASPLQEASKWLVASPRKLLSLGWEEPREQFPPSGSSLCPRAQVLQLV